ncbi:ImmA/IrrE family metallo-endopeptidase [Rhodovibrio sodomensis]|nr:ImmA/IrrE family metallo-endopeptidase [Rhodovibrio sodomensis]
MQPLMILQRVSQDPVDLDLLAAALDIDLIPEPMPDNLCLVLQPIRFPRFDELRWTLKINADHPETRRRFSIAHAIGHLAHHPKLIGEGLCDDLEYRCPTDGPRANAAIDRHHETEANRIAVGILMPCKAVQHRHAQFADLDQLAGHFRVSPAAMRIRLEALSLPVPPMHSLLAGAR